MSLGLLTRSFKPFPRQIPVGGLGLLCNPGQLVDTQPRSSFISSVVHVMSPPIDYTLVSYIIILEQIMNVTLGAIPLPSVLGSIDISKETRRHQSLYTR